MEFFNTFSLFYEKFPQSRMLASPSVPAILKYKVLWILTENLYVLFWRKVG